MLGNHSTTELYPQPRNSVACESVHYCPLIRSSYCLRDVILPVVVTCYKVLPDPALHLTCFSPQPPVLKIKHRVAHTRYPTLKCALWSSKYILIKTAFIHFFLLLFSSQYKSSKMAHSQESPISNRLSLHPLLCVGGRPICSISAFSVCQFSLKIEIRTGYCGFHYSFCPQLFIQPTVQKEVKLIDIQYCMEWSVVAQNRNFVFMLNSYVMDIIGQQNRVSVSRNLRSHGEEDD